jgi:hypothetical protein
MLSQDNCDICLNVHLFKNELAVMVRCCHQELWYRALDLFPQDRPMYAYTENETNEEGLEKKQVCNIPYLMCEQWIPLSAMNYF